MGPLGFWECERVPFGFTNAPATFQRLMESCPVELHLSWCIIYLDDIIVFSLTPEEHLVRLQAVFNKLKAADLKLKPSKCELFRKQINYLGHVVGYNGVSTDPKKIKAITEWPRPTTVAEVRSFLGFVSYYRRFIPNFSKVAKPLNKLLKIFKELQIRRRNLKYIGDQNSRKPLRLYKGSALKPLYWHMQISNLHLSFTLMPLVMDWGQCYTKTRMVRGELKHMPQGVCLQVRGIIQFINWNSVP